MKTDKEYTLALMKFTTLGEDTQDMFNEWFLKTFDCNVKFFCEVETYDKPKVIYDKHKKWTDIFFFVHKKDLTDFLFKRGQYNIILWDEIDNPYTRSLYPQEFINQL
ncbi:MAG: hypothetical protein RLZZ479_906 [Bacteroidota bacterium]|jgi:hypothetical protein